MSSESLAKVEHTFHPDHPLHNTLLEKPEIPAEVEQAFHPNHPLLHNTLLKKPEIPAEVEQAFHPNHPLSHNTLLEKPAIRAEVDQALHPDHPLLHNTLLEKPEIPAELKHAFHHDQPILHNILLEKSESPTEMEHACHPDHPLHHTLLEKPFLCACCNHKVHGRAYKCDTCDEYVLHVRCALFPENFQHDFHNHQLSLIPNVADDFTCKACAKRIQGFAYHCDTCADDYSLHPVCSSAHEKVQHDKHPKHPLTLSASVPYRNNRFECKVCNQWYSTSDQWVYRCASCKFDVHLDCASSAKVVAVAAGGASSNVSRRGRSNVFIPIGVRVASKAASSAVAGATRKAVGATEHAVHSAGDAVSGAFGKVVGSFGDAFGD